MKFKALVAATCAFTAMVGILGVRVVMAAQSASASEPTCKLSPVDAIKIAKTKIPGRTIQATFEFEDGKWVYGVMIVTGKSIKEVIVDASSGKIGDIESVTPNDEAKEIKAELERALGEKAPSRKK